MAKKKINTSVLAYIVSAGEGGTFAPRDEAQPLADHKPALVEINEGATDDNGNVAVRATAEGISHVTGVFMSQIASTGTVAANKSNFEVSDVPADIMQVANENRRASRGAGEKYPFDSLEVGKGFFVPATEKMPEPAKSLASTVSSAQARYAEETGETKTVKSKEYQLDENGKRVKDDEGHWIVTSETDTDRPKMRNTRLFKLVAADNGAWVVRKA